MKPQSSAEVALYSKEILRWAATIPITEDLPNPQGQAKVRAPLCGSYITVSLNIADGRISDYSHNVKACALGQAAASIIARAVVGLEYDTLVRAREQLFLMLSADGEPPCPPFEDLAILQLARPYKNRHGSILLSFDATIAAFLAISD